MGRFFLFGVGLLIPCLLIALLAGTGAVFAQPDNETVLTVSSTQDGAVCSQAVEELQLPVQIPGTQLVAERVVCYEGPYIEDGSDEPVSSITALVVRNIGKEEISQAEVILERAGEKLRFCVFDILPDMSVMVLEQNKAVYSQGEIYACSGWTRTAEYVEPILDLLQISAVDMGTLEITNLGMEVLSDIDLLHKNYLPDGTYVGGISYKTRIENIDPGQTIRIQPEHYANGYSKIFKAEKA